MAAAEDISGGRKGALTAEGRYNGSWETVVYVSSIYDMCLSNLGYKLCYKYIIIVVCMDIMKKSKLFDYLYSTDGTFFFFDAMTKSKWGTELLSELARHGRLSRVEP